MDLIYNVIFLVIWLWLGAFLVYMWAHFKYENKKEIDLCYEERKKFKEENQRLKHEIKENNETIKKLKKELEKAHREIAEKNKYLSEDKVVIERLSEIKALSDKISNILIDYDKDTIQHLLNEYQKWKFDNIEDEEDNNTKKW